MVVSIANMVFIYGGLIVRWS